jgi:hypothetical protein
VCRFTLAVAACAVAAGGAFAHDGELLDKSSDRDRERFVERTQPRRPVEYTQQRAGNPSRVAWWAVPGVSPHEAGGYIGGSRLSHNNALKKGEWVAPGPITNGTYGWDFVGFGIRPGRVFLRETVDPSRGPQINREYRTDGPRPPDPIALRPLRKAILEAQEEREEKKHGGEGGE